ncbi:hypothetical protein PENTCL1PPCAC_2052, partial [Pristionchus entomophagus]
RLSQRMRRACKVAVQLRLSSACSSVAGPSRSIVDHQERRSTVAMSSQDEKLIQRGEFYGVAATSGKKRTAASSSPELALSRLHEQLRLNYRVPPEAVMVELVLKLEKGNAALLSLLQRSPERWIPMSVRCCGRALSSIPTQNRRVIARRLWEQIEKRGLPISIGTINAHLRVNLDNDEKFDPFETLKEIEEKRGLVPDQETFHILLEKLSLSGATEMNIKMMQSYEMARRGHSSSDAISHSHLVYANAVRGFNRQADSLIQQSLVKFGSEGEALNLGAACVAAAAGGKIDRLRDLLRRSVDDNLQLRLSLNNVFDIIWALAEKTGDNEKNNDAVIEEILNRSQHPNGFFRFLYREIERHISAFHFRTSMILLEETMRVKDPLKNQSKSDFSHQMLGKMCRAMVKSRMEKGLTMEMANRMETTMNTRRRYIHDELMMATLTLKDCDMDDRFSSFSSLLPIVDPVKERPHLILPLLAIIPKCEERLKLIYRVSSLGYSNLDTLDSSLMANYLFQPMYKYQVWLAHEQEKRAVNPIENMATIIHSFGIPKASIWRMMQGWWKLRMEEEKELAIHMRMRPYSHEIQTWLRSSFSKIFTDRANQTVPIFPLTQSRLEAAIEKGDGSTILSLLSTHGWPQDVDLPSFAPKILELLIANESSGNIMKWLTALSREVSCRQEGNEEMMKSPLESHHMLKVMRHRILESEVTARQLIDMSYGLKRLFPQAISNYDSHLDTISETNRLIASCFIFKEGRELTMKTADDIIDLLRTLMQLEIVGLTQNELVTPYCVSKVLQRFGWESALRMWMQFQSSFSFGNGLAILLSHSFTSTSKERREKNVQFVLHKAGISLSPSRIHSIHAAVLVNTSKQEEEIKKAAKILEERASDISPSDCVFAYKLINNLKYPPTQASFIRTFPSLCLTLTKLAEDEEAAKAMLHSSLIYCEMKRLGGLMVEMSDLFAQYGIEPDEKEKRRVENAMEAHERLVDRWIFSPKGLIQARADQDFVKEGEWKKYVRDPVI